MSDTGELRPDSAKAKDFSLLILTAVTLACLLPFIGKAFHIDDPLFVWSARHIVFHPGDCYGFSINWFGTAQSMSAVMENPPLTSYYMAPVGALCGWNEIALHAWFLLPALATVIGSWRLAQKFCAHPLAAGLIVVAAPAFILSGTNVMCDTMMLAFWVWAVDLWMDGLAQDSPGRLCAAGFLMAGCELTKYFGLSLIPLLLVYSLMVRRQAGKWMVWLLIPVAAMGLYQWLTYRLYGYDLLFRAASYTLQENTAPHLLTRVLVGFSFTGGCIVILLPLAPFLWSRKALAGGAVAVVLTGLVVAALGELNKFQIVAPDQIKWSYLAQFSLAVAAGASLIVLAAADWRKEKTPASMLLLLWVTGTFLFVCFVNWTVSGRNILPMVPAAAILLVRRLEWRSLRNILKRLSVPLGISLLLGLLAAWSDYLLADSARNTAMVIQQTAGVDPAHLWFEGHWGFQYYMKQGGCRPIDRNRPHFFSHDIIAMPRELSNFIELDRDHVSVVTHYYGATLPWFATMSARSGAGYYMGDFGPMPFVFCPDYTNQYVVFRVK